VKQSTKRYCNRKNEEIGLCFIQSKENLNKTKARRDRWWHRCLFLSRQTRRSFFLVDGRKQNHSVQIEKSPSQEMRQRMYVFFSKILQIKDENTLHRKRLLFALLRSKAWRGLWNTHPSGKDCSVPLGALKPISIVAKNSFYSIDSPFLIPRKSKRALHLLWPSNYNIKLPANRFFFLAAVFFFFRERHF
jgi:hypothetical protein